MRSITSLSSGFRTSLPFEQRHGCYDAGVDATFRLASSVRVRAAHRGIATDRPLAIGTYR